MRRSVLLKILWALSIFGYASTGPVISCSDKNACEKIRAIVSDPQDVLEVFNEYSRSQEVDLHGNLLNEYHHPTMVQWKTLNISYNLLSQDIFRDRRYNHVETVDLTYNRLTVVSIPSSIKKFIAERNQLHAIIVPGHNNLKTLILPKNKFSSFQKFKDLQQLQELDLSCNELSELKVDELPSSLQTLRLARNHIHKISGTNKLTSLKYLDLSQNILTIFFATPFPSVVTLYLQRNKVVMWLEKINNKFQEVNLNDNDWHCPNVKEVSAKIKELSNDQVLIKDESKCDKSSMFCCSTTAAPYADRLIKYRKQEFNALKEGSERQQTGNFSCDKFESNPCAGDDDLVFRVAKSAIKNANSLSESTLKHLEVVLKSEKNIAIKLEQNVTSAKLENDRLNASYSDLVAYINRQYTATVPGKDETFTGNPHEVVQKLQQIFQYYEKAYKSFDQQLTEVERANEDKVKEIETLQNEIDDLIYQQDILAQEVAQRNATVNAYNAKIEALQAKLG